MKLRKVKISLEFIFPHNLYIQFLIILENCKFLINQLIMNQNALKMLVLLFFMGYQCFSQQYYWIEFTDKDNSPFSLSHPEDYLSQRSIDRRIKQNIHIDSLDLPVN